MTQELPTVDENMEAQKPVVHDVLSQDAEHEQKSVSFFDKIAFLRLSDTKKSEVADKVLDDLFVGKLYFIELMLSAVIAALGLLINSTAVVIGAMLIAPILAPIQ